MFRYEIWYKGRCFYEGDGFYTYDEAVDTAASAENRTIEILKSEGTWQGETILDLDARIIDV